MSRAEKEALIAILEHQKREYLYKWIIPANGYESINNYHYKESQELFGNHIDALKKELEEENESHCK